MMVLSTRIPRTHERSESALDDLGSEHLHQLYMATGSMLARLSEYMDQSGHEHFVATNRERMRRTFEQVLIQRCASPPAMSCDFTLNCTVAGV